VIIALTLNSDTVLMMRIMLRTGLLNLLQLYCKQYVHFVEHTLTETSIAVSTPMLPGDIADNVVHTTQHHTPRTYK